MSALLKQCLYSPGLRDCRALRSCSETGARAVRSGCCLPLTETKWFPPSWWFLLANLTRLTKLLPEKKCLYVFCSYEWLFSVTLARICFHKVILLKKTNFEIIKQNKIKKKMQLFSNFFLNSSLKDYYTQKWSLFTWGFHFFFFFLLVHPNVYSVNTTYNVYQIKLYFWLK